MRNRYFTRVALFLGAAMALAACGGPELTVKMVLEDEGTKVTAMKEAMAKAAAALPADGASVPKPSQLQPVPHFELGKLDANVMFVRTEHLTNRAAPAPVHFLSNYRYGSDWMSALEEGDPAKTRDEKQLASDGTLLRNRLRSAVKVAYVVLIRLEAHEPPSLVDSNTFTGGTASFDAFLVDLGSGDVLAGCDIDATADRTVEYKYGPDEKQEDIDKRMLANAQGSLMKNASDLLAACLAERTGGTFKLI